MRRLAWVVLVAVAAACSTDDGRAMRPPPPGATSPPRTTEPTTPSVAPADAAFVVVAESFAEGGAIPVEHTCDGDDVSPGLSWSGFPEGPVEFAVMVTDPDAEEFLHWAVWGIPGDVTSFGPGSLPEGAVEGENDFGEAGWSGPCPPSGQTHRYVIQVHAMEAPLGLEAGASGDDFRAALASFAHGTLTATYTR